MAGLLLVVCTYECTQRLYVEGRSQDGAQAACTAARGCSRSRGHCTLLHDSDHARCCLIVAEAPASRHVHTVACVRGEDGRGFACCSHTVDACAGPQLVAVAVRWSKGVSITQR